MMKYANIWAIGEIWTKLRFALGNVESTALRVTGLLQSLRERYAERVEEVHDYESIQRGRFSALLDMTLREGDQLLATVLTSRDLIIQRQEVLAEILRASDPTLVVWEALDEAEWILQAAGVSPLILLFDQAEAERVGQQPLEDLEISLRRMVEFIGELNRPEDRELLAALQVALESVQRLAEGAKKRQWQRRVPSEAEAIVENVSVRDMEVMGQSEARTTRDPRMNSAATGEGDPTTVKGGSKRRRRKVPKSERVE